MPDARSPIRHHLVLYRRDPEQGRARFFSLMIERDLFGTIRLVRNWGLVGSKGREQVEIFSDEAEAAQALETLGHSPATKGLYGPLISPFTMVDARLKFPVSRRIDRSTEMDAHERTTAPRCWANHSRRPEL